MVGASTMSPAWMRALSVITSYSIHYTKLYEWLCHGAFFIFIKIHPENTIINSTGITIRITSYNVCYTKLLRTEFDGKPVYDYLLELTDPEKVMFQLDLYWIAQGGKDCLDYFKKYPGRFYLYHIKDEKELGESGTMDFAAAFAARP